VKKDKLLQYCEDHKIVVSKDATIGQLNAAISRASMHKTEVHKQFGSCFGFWEYENSICLTCEFEKSCFKTVFGMDKEKYEKKLDALESPKASFSGKMMKSKGMKI
jgi:hypothetical protein